MGGARRDEEKARAKERFFSHRNEFGQWDPKSQRPELWNVYNAKVDRRLLCSRYCHLIIFYKYLFKVNTPDLSSDFH